jgi:hypothetical protein
MMWSFLLLVWGYCTGSKLITNRAGQRGRGAVSPRPSAAYSADLPAGKGGLYCARVLGQGGGSC